MSDTYLKKHGNVGLLVSTITDLMVNGRLVLLN